MVSWLRMASTATLSPCTTLNTPSGSPASAHSEASSSDADGSFSDGLSTKVLPHAIASGNIHIGTMAGKLNGVMPATTPTGCLIEYESTPVETFSENPPLSRCGMPQANSTTSRPRATSPAASEATLPCSARDQLRYFAGVGPDELAEGEQHRGAPGQRDPPPGRERVRGRRDREVHLGRGGEVDLAADLPGGRVVHVAVALGLAVPGLAGDPVGDVFLLASPRASARRSPACSLAWPLRSPRSGRR